MTKFSLLLLFPPVAQSGPPLLWVGWLGLSVLLHLMLAGYLSEHSNRPPMSQNYRNTSYWPPLCVLVGPFLYVHVWFVSSFEPAKRYICDFKFESEPGFGSKPDRKTLIIRVCVGKPGHGQNGSVPSHSILLNGGHQCWEHRLLFILAIHRRSSSSFTSPRLCRVETLLKLRLKKKKKKMEVDILWWFNHR